MGVRRIRRRSVRLRKRRNRDKIYKAIPKYRQINKARNTLNKEPKLNSKYGNKTRQEWWEDRFPKMPVVYKAQHNSPRDVRNFIFDKSYILEDIVVELVWDT